MNSFTRTTDTVGSSATYTVEFTTLSGSNGDLLTSDVYIYFAFL